MHTYIYFVSIRRQEKVLFLLLLFSPISYILSQLCLVACFAVEHVCLYVCAWTTKRDSHQIQIDTKDTRWTKGEQNCLVFPTYRSQKRTLKQMEANCNCKSENRCHNFGNGKFLSIFRIIRFFPASWKDMCKRR